MKTIPVNLQRLRDAFDACEGVVKYHWGTKVPLYAIPGQFKRADCSAFARWLLYYATSGKVAMPDGSWHQREWCIAQGFKKTAGGYATGAALEDHRLRLAFLDPEGGKAGHVWLVYDLHTMECSGGKGVNSRPWNTPVLLKNVDSCFALSDPLE